MRSKTTTRNSKIVKKYEELKDTAEQSVVLDQLAEEFKLGKLYVKQILRSSGIEIERKDSGPHPSRNEHISDRDKNIIKKIESGSTPEEIGVEFNITPTRVRQIVRDNLPKFKITKLERSLAEIKSDVYNGVKYEEIVSKYGEKTIRDIKSNLGYNLFKACRTRRDAMIVEMSNKGMIASKIGDKMGLSKDYVYTILHKHNVRKDTHKITDPKKRAARNKKIVEMYLNREMSIGAVAKKFDLTYTMVKLIINDAILKEYDILPDVAQLADKYRYSEDSVKTIVSAQKKNTVKKQ